MVENDLNEYQMKIQQAVLIRSPDSTYTAVVLLLTTPILL
jgi:hypothetical protein